MSIKSIHLGLLLCLQAFSGCSSSAQKSELERMSFTQYIPTAGNAYCTENRAGATVGKNGIAEWTDGSTISIYFKAGSTGKLDIGLRGYAPSGTSVVTLSVAGKSFDATFSSATSSTVAVGSVEVAQPGYIRIDLKGKSKTGESFACIDALALGNVASQGTLTYVSSPDFFYWGRRGPSVHMSYTLPAGQQEFFYNEVTVPAGQDVEGSYYMANGFGQGYFGIQVNSATERRVLFSVWSPFTTDDPNAIPENHKIVLLKKGDGVKTGEFGNEGSGGQSYLVFPWKADLTYRFLTRIRPTQNDQWGQACTEYTAYFFDAAAQRWMLIASWKRPSTSTYYTSPYSFLENFNPAQGYITRKVYFGNQWARDASGVWREIPSAKFTCDETGRKGGRVDFAGGSEGNRFFLKSFGFFNEMEPPDRPFTRTANGGNPPITEQELQAILAL